MNTSTCATTDPRQYSRRSRQRRRAKQLQRRRMIVALIALGLAFFLGYLSGCGMQRARNPQTVPNTALAATVARVECIETNNPLDGNGGHRGHPTAHRAGPLP